jgi:hypothetical protein
MARPSIAPETGRPVAVDCGSGRSRDRDTRNHRWCSCQHAAGESKPSACHSDPVRRRLAVRVLPPDRPAGPGPLPRAVRARLADLFTAGDAGAARCCSSDASRPGGAAGAARGPANRRGAGKIVHEYRAQPDPWFEEMGWPVRDGELRYYGSADATSWFLVVLAALGDRALEDELSACWRAASGWVERALERGRGLVRHGPRRTEGGLLQQGWRDTSDPLQAHGGGILDAYGRVPEPPLADADTQAVTVAALRATARRSGMHAGSRWPIGRWSTSRARPRRSRRASRASAAKGCRWAPGYHRTRPEAPRWAARRTPCCRRDGCQRGR